MTLLGITLIITALLLLKDVNRGLIICKRFKDYGPQLIRVKITGKKTIRFKRSHIFEFDRSLQKFLTCSFEIEGFHCTGYLPEQPKYQVGQDYFISGYYYPSDKLFLPADCSSYRLRFRKFHFPYLIPPFVVYPPENAQKPA